MPVVEILTLQAGGRMLVWECPGCGNNHGIPIERAEHPVWEWNGDAERPTLAPSILARTPHGDNVKICHSFLRDGKMEFLGDCTHELAGQTVQLPQIAKGNE